MAQNLNLKNFIDQFLQYKNGKKLRKDTLTFLRVFNVFKIYLKYRKDLFFSKTAQYWKLSFIRCMRMLLSVTSASTANKKIIEFQRHEIYFTLPNIRNECGHFESIQINLLVCHYLLPGVSDADEV